MDPITNDEMMAVYKADHAAYLGFLDKAIGVAVEIIKQRQDGQGFTGGNGDLDEWVSIIMDLFKIRADIFSGKALTQIERSERIFFYRFQDGWDPRDSFGNFVACVMVYYLNHDRIHVDPACKDDPLIAQAAAFALPINERIVREFRAQPLPDADPDTLDLPHRPDRRSLELMHEAALASIRRGGPEFGGAAGAEFSLGQQHLLLGLTERFFKRPNEAVIKHLRHGYEILAHALEMGYAPHAWDVHHLFLGAVAVDDRALAERLIAMRQEKWDDARIRAVPWLILRILACFSLFRGDDAHALALIERYRIGVFVDKLPSELERDLPEMHNYHHVLRALAERDATAFNAQLAERMAIRATMLRSSPLDTNGLCDLPGLALCRFARARGMAVQVRHVYLPLELLDIPPATDAAG